MSHELSVRLCGVEKNYPDFALGPIDLSVEPGSVIALVGPNGSGKTTTLHCMMDLVRPSAGTIEIAGASNRSSDPSWKQRVGFVGEMDGYYRLWTVQKNLDFLSRFYSHWSAERASLLCRRFGLAPNKKINQLSLGNRRKLALIAALAHSPTVLLLDEPTVGLDPVVRAEVLDVLWETIEDGETSILYSTHVLSDISRLADELVFLREGRLLGRFNKEDLLDSWRRVTFRTSGELPAMAEVSSRRAAGSEHQLVTSDFEKTAATLGAIGAENLHANHLTVEEIAVEVLRERHSVEDVRNNPAA